MSYNLWAKIQKIIYIAYKCLKKYNNNNWEAESETEWGKFSVVHL